MLELGLSPTAVAVQGAPLRITVNDILYERAQDEETGEFGVDEATGEPVYGEV